MDEFDADVVVIGAGAVGLACGAAFARKEREVLVLETESAIATHTSSRNSEVIHAGLNYAKGSNKAKLSVAGRRLLYPYCDARGIQVQRCGKLVVAVGDDEREALANLQARALANDVEDVVEISGDEARALEPELGPDVVAALKVGVSGVFDSHSYFLALQGEIEEAGGAIAFDTPVVRGEVSADDGRILVETGGASPARVRARCVVNSAGHGALEMARSIDGGPDYPELKMYWVKGNYFVVSGRGAFSRLIYPIPSHASQGLHLTVDMGGAVRLGPDVEWLEDWAGPPFDYVVDPARAPEFCAKVQRYWPGLDLEQLSPGYSGVRPKIVGPGEPSGDFLIDGPEHHGVPGLVNLIGIESPGLTSSLAIGERVERLVAG